jgi:serine/threonine protein phosphatase PrpC
MVYNLLNMLECPNCALENRPEARFCRFCGYDLASPANLLSQDTMPELQQKLVMEQSDNPAQDALQNLAPGRVLHGRYRLLRLVEAAETSNIFEAQDLLRCWNCKAVQVQAGLRFCEVCGAELSQNPTVTIDISPESDTEFTEDDVIRFVENGVRYRIVPLSTNIDDPPKTSAYPLRFVIGYQSHPGRVRDNNEDSLLIMHLAGICEMDCIPAIGFFVVADGVGGSASGEVASRMAVRRLAAAVIENIFLTETTGDLQADRDLSTILSKVILAANQAILDLRQQDQENVDMGSTLTTALLRGARAYIANVGDSRTYRMSNGKLTPVTRDHSVVARLVEHGLIEPHEVYSHDQRSIIYRSLGSRPDLEVDVFELELEPGERLLLCSDGLWEMVRDGMIEEVLLDRRDPRQACDRLVELANLAGGEDNISVIIIDIVQ